MYRNEDKCLFIEWISDEKESAWILRVDDSNICLAHKSDLKKI
jgi:hypothetical protein